jgi:GT2 family glycosyltransferase
MGIIKVLIVFRVYQIVPYPDKHNCMVLYESCKWGVAWWMFRGVGTPRAALHDFHRDCVDMLKFSIITPNFNGARYLEQTLASVAGQRSHGVAVEHIVMDALSTDGSAAILARYADRITCVRERDSGPADAINKGLQRADGDILAWLNADDLYDPGALARAADVFAAHPDVALCFGRCRIIDEQGLEIRQGITRFKECFFSLSSRFTLQSINYISQPAMFFRRSAFEKAGLLREDLKAAWDYEYILRLWRQGGGVVVAGGPLASFRWHPQSISGQHFRLQFREEYDAAVADAGPCSLQALLHLGVRYGIVGIYAVMARRGRNKL